MRNYLFIDLHIHSVYSFETDCDATPEEILENTLATVKKVQNSMIERVNECVAGGSEEELDKLIIELSPYFADKKEEQEQIRDLILNSGNKVQTLKDYIINNTKCCISITDHQNVQGSKEAIKLIKKHSQKYTAIDFIPGIEVNAGLRCMGINEEGFSSFKKCHTLAYGYDIGHPDLNAFSRLYNFKYDRIDDTTTSRFGIEIGKMILLAKKRVDDITGETIPIRDLGFIVNNTQSCLHAKNKFYSYLKEHYPTRNFRKMPEIEECFDFTARGNDNAINGSKWELDEFMQATRNAGGYFAIAHPYSIKKKRTATEELACNNEFVDALILTTKDNAFETFRNLSYIDKYVILSKVTAINSSCNKNYSADEIYQMYITFTFGRNIEDFVKKVIQIRGDNNFGFEIFNKLNLSGAKSKVLYDIARKYNLYLTGGSDHHGPNLHTSNIISRCFDKSFIYSPNGDLFTMPEDELQQRIDKANSYAIDNTLVYMPFIGLVKNKHRFKDRQQIGFYNRQNGTVELDNSLFDRHKTWIVKRGWTVEGVKNYFDTTGVDHISRKDFIFFKELSNLADSSKTGKASKDKKTSTYVELIEETGSNNSCKPNTEETTEYKEEDKEL